MINSKLESKKPLTQLAKKEGLQTWETLTEFIKKLPYGRNINREDFALVFKERKGTCSSKHGLLKKIAEENNFENVKLFLVLFKMNAENTPKIKKVLSKKSIEYIPEAHIILKIDDAPLDVTNNLSNFSTIEHEVIVELEINTEQLSSYKIQLHQNYLKEWLKKEKLSYSFSEIWKIREACITALSQ